MHPRGGCGPGSIPGSPIMNPERSSPNGLISRDYKNSNNSSFVNIVMFYPVRGRGAASPRGLVRDLSLRVELLRTG